MCYAIHHVVSIAPLNLNRVDMALVLHAHTCMPSCFVVKGSHCMTCVCLSVHCRPSASFCLICGGGGELICCDGCPGSYHASCATDQQLRDDDAEKWYCHDCLGGTKPMVEDVVWAKVGAYRFWPAQVRDTSLPLHVAFLHVLLRCPGFCVLSRLFVQHPRRTDATVTGVVCTWLDQACE